MEIGQVPPHSKEAEQSILGCMMLDAKALDEGTTRLCADAFYVHSHQVIFQAMVRLHMDGREVDMVTVTDELREMGKLSEVGGGSYIADLSTFVPSTAGYNEYIRIVADHYTARRLIQVAADIQRRGYGCEDISSVLEDAEARIFALTRTNKRAEYKTIGEAVVAALDGVESARRGGGLKTGFLDFDKATTGLWPGDYVLIAARPSMGKTALALNIAFNVAVNEKKPVGIFSLEMDAQQLALRMLSEHSGVPLLTMRSGELTEEQWDEVGESMRPIGNAPIYIDETSITPLEIRSQARLMAAKHDIKLMIIDYLQLISSGEKWDSRQQEISAISRSLKLLAKELGIPVIVLSQLNRGPESRSDHRPILSDLRDSGAIEQDADVVSFLYRDEYYFPETNDVGVAEWIIAKQRNGPTRTMYLRWDAEHAMFQNLVRTRF